MTAPSQKQTKAEELKLFFKEEGLEEDYEQVIQKWDFVQLCIDLENLDKSVLDDPLTPYNKKVTLSDKDKKILLLMLYEKNPEEIAEILQYAKVVIKDSIKIYLVNPNTVSEHYSKKLFKLIWAVNKKADKASQDKKEFEKFKKNWRNMILSLMDKYYKSIQEDLSRYRESENQYKTLTLKIDEDVSQQTIDTLIETMKELMATQSLNEMFLTNVTRGCLETHWKASPEAIEKIAELHRQGLLSQKLGVTVLNVKVISEESPLVNISNWLQGTWEQGWQSLEDFLQVNQLQTRFGYARSTDIRGVKKLDLGLRINQQSVALIINVTPIEAGEVHILAQVSPIGKQHLSQGLKLLITLESERAEVIAREADNFIQLSFTEKIGKSFTIQLELEDSVITEEFVV